MSQVEPFAGTYADIEQIAKHLRLSALNGKEMNNGAFLTNLVERTGGAISVASDPTVQEAEGGSLVIRGEKDYTIFLSPYTSKLRDNFTIGHELGHYVLHFIPRKQELSPPLWFTRYGTGRMEWQANRFAAALLMPSDLFQQRLP